MEKQEIFADGIGQIHFAGNMVRMDLVSLEPSGDGKAPTAESKVRIVMPPQGFIAAYDSMRRLIEKLVAAGVLKKDAK